jgi:hypothetical protein
MLNPSRTRPSRVAIVRHVASTWGTRSLMMMLSTGVEPSFQSTYMPLGRPLTKTARKGGVLPASIAASNRAASWAMPGRPPPDPCSQ